MAGHFCRWRIDASAVRNEVCAIGAVFMIAHHKL
jgi:hypothetical protein